MKYQFKFDRILQIKEREKEEASTLYQESIKKFEEVAQKLYEYLKRKEDLEAYQMSRLSNGLSVQEIRHYQQFISNLEKSIDYYQKMVINARNRMNYYQEKLVEKNIEVKKFEKMREKGFNQFMEEMKFIEAKQMDDISIQQYMHRGN